ncbi:restriction endonuclease subunit S [Nitrincola sp. A-D6]|uniref:restriction endonuclease subunit S n=1 Tax=Nitrincola sp. A-D6 TaxID=1545442 RepID=UPI00190F1052|nr:restriction endonuclease subunit S [Nitrincola sp. A-D6]
MKTTKSRLERIPEVLKTFRQSVLAAAVSGKLTEEWRGNIEASWTKSILANVCRSVSDGDHQAPPKADAGIPFLVISNVSNGEVDFDSVSRWVPEDYYESLKNIRKAEINDILYTVTGSFGIPVVVKSSAPFCFQRHIAIIKPDHTSVDYRYLYYYLASPEVFKHADSVATGTAQKTVSLTHLRNFSISLPTLEEQAEIVRRVEAFFAFADSIEQKVSAALTRVNNLTQSILAKAFRGELTAEWRAANPDLIGGENSAEKLLMKIQASRQVKQQRPKK